MIGRVESPLLEADLDALGVIEPDLVVPDADMPERVVLCFFGDVVTEEVAPRADARRVTVLASEIGPNPVWEITVSGRRLAVLQPGVGAPLAAAFCEEVIAMGARQLIACGGAGALIPELALGHAIVVDSAVRDEGTSHHYLPAGRRIEADPEPMAALMDALDSAGLAHRIGCTWTTDAVYRETRARVDRRVDEGCLAVEMETAALLAVARYRHATLGQVLLAGDTLAGETWDDRGWISAHDARRNLFWASAQAAAAL